MEYVKDCTPFGKVLLNETGKAGITREARRDACVFFNFVNKLAEEGKEAWATMLMSCLEDAAEESEKYENTLKKLKRKPFSKEEDDNLRQLVEASKDDIKKKDYWEQIAFQIPGRTPRQYRERWFNYLSPNIRKTNWTPEKDDVLRRSAEGLGPKWETISNFTNENPNSCKNRYNRLLREQQSPLNEVNYIGNPNANQTNQTDNINHSILQVADLDLTNLQQLMNPQQLTNPGVQPKVPLPPISSVFELMGVGEQIDLSSSLNFFEDIGNDFSLEQQNQQQDQGPTPNFD